MRKVVRKSKRSKIIVFMIVLLMLISIGYSAFQTTLKIRGTAKIEQIGWDIKFNNLQVKDGSVNPVKAAQLDENRTTVEYSVQFENPEEFYEFTVDAINNSSTDAMIASIEGDSLKSSLANYIDYFVSYGDGAPVEQYDKLAKNSQEKIRVRLKIKDGITLEELGDGTESFKLKFNYAQLDSNAKNRRRSTITSKNYGEKVNYSIKTHGVTLDSWKLFYENDGIAYIITDSYVPNAIIDTNKTSIATWGKYRAYWYNYQNTLSTPYSTNAIRDLTNTAAWSDLLNASIKAVDKRVVAKGGIDLDSWVGSWNAKGDLYGRTAYPRITINKNSYGHKYLNSYASASTSLSSSSGYNDKLYFPVQSTIEDDDIDDDYHIDYIKSYPLAFDYLAWRENTADTIMTIFYSGSFEATSLNFNEMALRPVIEINSAYLTKNGSVWEIK